MALKDDILKVFTDMKAGNYEGDGNDFFCSELAKIIKNYVASLKLNASSIMGSDTSPPGTFMGAVENGKLSISSSLIKAVLKAACIPTMTDEILATAFSTGLMADIVTFTCEIKGMTTPSAPPSTPAPAQDSGVVTAVFNGASILQALKNLFAKQKQDAGDESKVKDEDTASTLASEIKKFYTSPTSCVIKGATHLASSTGNGVISE